MEKDIDKLKMELIRSVVATDDRAVLQAALRVLQLHGPGTARDSEAPSPDHSDTAPDILRGGSPPDGDAKGLQDDIDEVFNPR